MLRAVAGVADVNSNGGLEEQYVVEPDPVRLTRHGVTAGELAARSRRIRDCRRAASSGAGPSASRVPQPMRA